MEPINELHITRPFMSGRSQAIRIPREYRLADEDVVINQIGDCLMITPRASIEKMFLDSLGQFTDDFLADGRPEEVPNRRLSL